MKESVLTLEGESLPLSEVGLYVRHDMSSGKDLLSIDLWADTGDLPEHFLAINGFTVADCRDIFDLQGRSFVLDKQHQEDEPVGDTASGELMESVMGESCTDPLMFESIFLKFGNLDGNHISVEISAAMFNSDRSGLPMEGSLVAKIETDGKFINDGSPRKPWWKIW
jgi:hypothetical protein